MKRPLTPVEAAEMPAWLARDFVYLLGRIRQLDEASEMSQWVERNIYKEATRDERLNPPRDLWN